jgi:hypothetical protein
MSSCLFSWFLICGLSQVLFLNLVDNFQFFSSHFPVTTLSLDILTSYCFYGAEWGKIAQSKRFTVLGASLPESRNSRLLKHHVSLKNNGQSPKKRRLYQ